MISDKEANHHFTTSGTVLSLHKLLEPTAL